MFPFVIEMVFKKTIISLPNLCLRKVGRDPIKIG